MSDLLYYLDKKALIWYYVQILKIQKAHEENKSFNCNICETNVVEKNTWKRQIDLQFMEGKKYLL